ncbi:hypothetical protein LTR22_001840 [Elasticomyces elasticus]|nr:hypothetical protein LTR22_001840 [Elasticomyces elasticus]KAK4932596.1 hypothetical protein LTR49_001020 [Elasticomyces elasticus]
MTYNKHGHSDLPEASEQHSTLEVMQNDATEKIALDPSPSTSVCQPVGERQSQQQLEPHSKELPYSTRRICGLSLMAFWALIIVVSIVVVGAAVGGGVGGSLASKSGSHNNGGDTYKNGSNTASTYLPTGVPLTSTAPNATSTTPTSVMLTTTEVVGPTTTLVRDCPSSNDTIYSSGSSEEPMLFRKFCGVNLFHVGGNDALAVNRATQSLNECIDLCAAFNIQNMTSIRAVPRAVLRLLDAQH